MYFELSSLGKEFKKKLEGGVKNKKYGIIYTPAHFIYISYIICIDTIPLFQQKSIPVTTLHSHFIRISSLFFLFRNFFLWGGVGSV